MDDIFCADCGAPDPEFEIRGPGPVEVVSLVCGECVTGEAA